jgi:hypothetical protein
MRGPEKTAALKPCSSPPYAPHRFFAVLVPFVPFCGPPDCGICGELQINNVPATLDLKAGLSQT